MGVATAIVEAEATEAFDVSSSTVDILRVQTHLVEMQAMYLLQTSCTSIEEQYGKLLDIEAEYCADTNIENFAHTVHQLHPVHYRNESAQVARKTPSLKSTVTKCLYHGCGNDLSLSEAYRVHIKDGSFVCGRCANQVSRGAIKMPPNTPVFERHGIIYESRAPTLTTGKIKKLLHVP
ncbi:Aste57867_10403 [Aphanomyces stellatus]|uniref:Aste57867_10403 protein n=1 Tax=Aphanomyces stellatus TaxID=120398 RepID=A0A485KQS0_9STRA|nr:hypothetical protein As57867_010363 [Aphanomyces stellatus]VFT87277.1 Aste57867_10403 [Aphanomyces stellatus]